MKNDVHKAMHTIEIWVNTFKSRNATEPLVNIASAVGATDSITDGLRTAEKNGNATFVRFMERGLKSNEIEYLYATLSTLLSSPRYRWAVLACTFSHSSNANMLFCIDTKQRRRYLDMTAI